MHTLGKVFLWVNLLLLIGAVLLSAKLINARNYWMAQVGQRETQITTNDAQIAEKEKQLAQVRSDLVRQRLAWDTMFLAPNSRAAADGTLTVGLGPDQGFGIAPEGASLPMVHVFIPQDQGQASKYLGPFQVTAAQGSQSQLRPMFRVTEGEPANWTASTWRLWQVVPSEAPARVVALTSEIVEALEAVASRQGTLALQTKAVEQARQHLDSRTKELLGNPQAPKIEGVPEVTDGLAQALRDTEAARNVELAELDRLRRAVADAYERLTQTVAQNERLARELSGGAGQGPTLSSAR